MGARASRGGSGARSAGMSPQRNVEETPTNVDDMRRRIEQLEEEVRASRSGQALLRAVLDNAPDFVSQIKPDGTFLVMNRLVAGSPHSDVVGRSAFEFVPAEWHAALRECLERVIRTQKPDHAAIVFSRLHGARRAGRPGRARD